MFIAVTSYGGTMHEDEFGTQIVGVFDTEKQAIRATLCLLIEEYQVLNEDTLEDIKNDYQFVKQKENEKCDTIDLLIKNYDQSSFYNEDEFEKGFIEYLKAETTTIEQLEKICLLGDSYYKEGYSFAIVEKELNQT